MMMERDSEAVVSEPAADDVVSSGLGEAQGHAIRAGHSATAQNSDGFGEVLERIARLKEEKGAAELVTVFTKARRQLLTSLASDEAELADIESSCCLLDSAMGQVLDVLTELSHVYSENLDGGNWKKTDAEIDEIEGEYSAAEGRAAEYFMQMTLRTSARRARSTQQVDLLPTHDREVREEGNQAPPAAQKRHEWLYRTSRPQ